MTSLKAATPMDAAEGVHNTGLYADRSVRATLNQSLVRCFRCLSAEKRFLLELMLATPRMANRNRSSLEKWGVGPGNVDRIE